MTTLKDALDDIPQFLRRPADPTASSPLMAAPEACVRRAPHLPHGSPIHQGRAPVVPPFAEAPARVPLAQPIGAEAQAAPERSVNVIALAPRSDGAEAAPVIPEPITMRAEIEAAAGDWPQGEEDHSDVAFQVTLPRSVIRQIRLCAASEGTTHRAIVLRAFRAAGLDVPEGADVDRRAMAARRRQQA